jgi:Helix-turn-helix domain
MAYSHIKEVREHSPLKGTARMIHSLIAQYANKDGVAYPSQERLALEARCTERYVRKVIQTLVGLSLIEVSQRMDNGHKHQNEYRVLTIPIPIAGRAIIGTGVPETQELGDRIIGTGVPLPIYRQEDQEEPEEPQKYGDPADRWKEPEVIGEIPGDEAPTAFPLTHNGTEAYFRTQAKKLGADGDQERLRILIGKMHAKGAGKSYDEIQGLIRLFFSKYSLDVRAKRTEYSAIRLFQQLLPRLENQRPRPMSAPSRYEEHRSATTLHETFAQLDAERRSRGA